MYDVPAIPLYLRTEEADREEMREVLTMEQRDLEYLAAAFSDLISYDADDPLQAIDPLTYRTPEGDSCLHVAAAKGDRRAVKLLLDAGLDANLRGDLGNTPLHYARKGGHQDIFDLLISRGALPSVVNELGEAAAIPK